MFTYFTDRDGRFQLKSLAESAFDPLSRTCRFMLTEEAFHMFVGTSGITRVVKRALDVMKALGIEDPAAVRNEGAIDLPTLQRYINFWFSSSLDLFGAEISSNAASYFSAGLKGRPDEARFADHLATGQSLRIEVPDGKDGATGEDVPMRSAMNEVTRAAYVRDCDVGVQRWNRLIAEAGYDFRFRLPSTRFRRSIGVWGKVWTDPDGHPVTGGEWQAKQRDWLPSTEDRAFVNSLMRRVTEPGKVAGWIAPPEIGINNAPLDYEYVRLN
jgi:benzoyl-CoA 2,3-dioxygenase component B